MKLSSKTITAIKMFIDLGEHYNEGIISLKDIAERKEISKKFLEQIVPSYKNSVLLLCNRGNQGGYRLAKYPSQITLKEIIYPLENFLVKDKTNSAPIDDFLSRINNILDDYFSGVTLSTLIEEQKESYINSYSI